MQVYVQQLVLSLGCSEILLENIAKCPCHNNCLTHVCEDLDRVIIRAIGMQSPAANVLLRKKKSLGVERLPRYMRSPMGGVLVIWARTWCDYR